MLMAWPGLLKALLFLKKHWVGPCAGQIFVDSHHTGGIFVGPIFNVLPPTRAGPWREKFSCLQFPCTPADTGGTLGGTDFHVGGVLPPLRAGDF